jgi:lysophospholipase L1-like esterase
MKKLWVFIIPLAIHCNLTKFFANKNHIITFGDSLTHGWVVSSTGKEKHPYTINLAIKLQEYAKKYAWPGYDVRVDEYGVNGEQTTTMKYRIKKVVSQFNDIKVLKKLNINILIL